MTPRFPAPGSLRLRFMLVIMLWASLGIGGIWWSATNVFRIHVENSFHEELEVHVRELGRLANIDPNGQVTLSRPLSDPRFEVPLSGYYWQITIADQSPLRSSSMTRGELDDRIAHSPAIHHTTETGPTGPAIAYGFTRKAPNGDDVHFVMATDQSELDRVMEGFTHDLTLWLAALGCLLLATGLAMISFSLKPLDRLSAALARLRQGEADSLEGRYPAEISPLVENLNDYLQQNVEMVLRARVQAGNLAHSLRTPLAVITDEAERLSTSETGKLASAVVLEQAYAMTQQIEYQLARSRSSGGQLNTAMVAQAPQIAVPILRAMERLHPDKQFVLETRIEENVAIQADAIDYAEVLSILLDNAGKWANAMVCITFSELADGRIEAAIMDDGPGISACDLERAFEVGTRFDPGKPGSGLGLAIARDLCAALDIELTLQDTGSGLLATVAAYCRRS